MAKRGSGGWFKRERRGNRTTTYSKRGITTSFSTGSTRNGGTRTTYTSMPGGKTRTTYTISGGGGWFKRETKTSSSTRKRPGRPRKVKITASGCLGYIVLGFILFVWISLSK